MLRTEEEAKKCWCPLARAAVSDDHQTANFGDNLMRGRSSMACIASECMAWRWENRGKPILVPAGADAPSDDYVKRGQTHVSRKDGVTVFDEYVLGFTAHGAHGPGVYGRCGLSGLSS